MIHTSNTCIGYFGKHSIKGISKCGWNWDFSNTTGKNDFHYYGDKTFNASLGTGQNTFDDGGFSLLQNTTNIDLTKKINGIGSLNLAFGAEYRFENYKIYKGELNSYTNFDLTFTKFSGAQGYPVTSLRMKQIPQGM